MNIDFPPPSKGTYNNVGSSRRLCNYLEHEDMKRMEQGIYTEGFFNLTENSLYKSQVVSDIDNNKAQLLKTDAKFYAIHISPSEQELKAMGNTEQEQVEAMKRYIREVVIPEYAKNFNKGLSAEDIKFYGKIHFDRNRSENTEGNMHCHLIVSRKDQSNKIKLSPLTNHKNTKKGTVKGGFDRTELFQQVEQGFDSLFNYDRQLTETFEYCNTIKNGSIADQLKMQQREYANTHVHENVQTQQHKSVGTDIQLNVPTNIQPDSQKGQSDMGLSSVLVLFTPDVSNQGEEQVPMKKKKPKRGLGQ